MPEVDEKVPGKVPGKEENGQSSNYHIIGQLREFQLGITEWAIYKARLSSYFKANRISDEDVHKATILNMLDEDAYKLIFNLCSPEKPEEKSYKELLSTFDVHFAPQHSIFTERLKFYEARKTESQSPKEWIAHLRSLAVPCEFGNELEVLLRDKFIVGYERGSVLERLLEEKKSAKLEEIMAIAENKMAVQSRFSVQRNNSGFMKAEVLHLRHDQVTKTGHFRGKPTAGGSSERQTSSGRPKERQRGCVVCGKNNHVSDKCFHKFSTCHICNKKGHISAVCRQAKFKASKDRHNYLQGSKIKEELPLYCFNENNESQEFSVSLKISDVIAKCQIDTGSGVSCISEKLYRDKFWNLRLVKTNKRFLAYDGKIVCPLGFFRSNVYLNKVKRNLDFFVIANGGPPLVGRDFLKAFNYKFLPFNFMEDKFKLQQILEKYDDVLSDKLGKFTKGLASIKLKDINSTPKFCKARQIPFAIREQVEHEINRLVSLGIITPVDFSDWATPVVPVFKKDGSVRLCGDYKITVNPAIEIDKYPLPRIEDLFYKLQGGVQFTKLDLSHAYQQICLDEKSRKLLTINTHKGLFRYNRLAFGIASAPAKFQKIMDSLLDGLEGVCVFIDDILITGKTVQEHLGRLLKVLNIFREAGLKVGKDKCVFFQDQVEYLGYIIDKDGLKTSKSKVVAIEKAPTPTNITQLKSFLGMVNYYGKFIKNLSTVLYPLFQLLRKDRTWEWSEKCAMAFKDIKSLLVSSQVLVHFNPSLELRLTVDASAYGVGAVLSHRFPSGVEKPIAYASRTLAPNECNFSQIEKEALAIIFGVTRFNQYVYGRNFTLVTDHRPLVTIFSPQKEIPHCSVNRIRRWAIILSAYQYNIEYIKSENNNADSLSRLPIDGTQSDVKDSEMNYCFFFSKSKDFTLNLANIAEETNRSDTLKKLKEYIKNGWPSYVNDKELKQFYNKRYEFEINNSCIFWNHRLVIPERLRNCLLAELHLSHLGIVKMKNVARAYFWWPGLDKAIEDLGRSCEACATFNKAAGKVSLNSWEWPKEPWSRLHLDFLGPLMGHYFLIVVDAHTKWLEVFPMSSPRSENVIIALRNLIARFGLPQLIVSDNGTSFTSDEFRKFLELNNIQLTTSPPYHPSSNGAAENSVKTVKLNLKKSFYNTKKIDLHRTLANFLFLYRNAPHSTTGVSPSYLMFGRNLRTKFDVMLTPQINVSNVEKNVKIAQDKQKRFYGGKIRSFEVNEHVYVKDYRITNKVTFVKGIIEKKIGKCVYLVRIPHLKVCWKRHANQIKTGMKPLVIPVSSTTKEDPIVYPGSSDIDIVNEDVVLPNAEEYRNDSETSSEAIVENCISNNRPKRNVRRPIRYGSVQYNSDPE